MKYVCPHCGEKTISPIKKAFAGTQKSRGVKCPECGGHCTNGMQSAVFRCIVSIIVLIIAVVSYTQLRYDISAIVIAASIAGGFVITRIFDAFFFPMAPSLRMDLK